MCDGLGRQFSYSCPNTTLFQQRMLICDHWYMVNCSKSEDDYSANLLIGQREKKFVDDTDEHPYHRTPRPDLLSHPSIPVYNTYRESKSYSGTSKNNVVGINTNYNEKDYEYESTDQPAYFPPTHWSTEYSKQQVTRRPVISYKPVNNTSSKVNLDQNIQESSISSNRGQAQKEENIPDGKVPVNFYSLFKATTPVFPKVVDFTTPLPPGDEIGLSPPKEEKGDFPVNFKSEFKATTPVFPKVVDFTTPLPPGDEVGLSPPKANKNEFIVNYKSSFKATTPVFPEVVDFTTPLPPADEIGLSPPKGNEEVPINFKSQFQATTPVFPEVVDFTTPLPPADEVGLLPPKGDSEEVPVNFNSTFKATTPVFPEVVDFTTPLPPADEIGLIPPKDQNETTSHTQLEQNHHVNFQSNFSATTPVYPKVVDFIIPIPPGEEIGLLPPVDNQNVTHEEDTSFLSTDLLPPKTGSLEQVRNTANGPDSVAKPSMFYQPPKYQPDYATETQAGDHDVPKSVKNIRSEKDWNDLRRVFLIPDYDFPLEAVSRPSYDSGPNSFQVDIMGTKRNV